MPRIVTLICVLLCPLFLDTQARGRDVDAAAIEAIVESARKAWEVPGVSVAIVQNDRVVFEKGFGVREIGTDKQVTLDTLFAIASCTKAFTATSVAMLADDGVMAWDDPVRKHLSYFHLADPLADQQVTLRDLMCHRTGMSRHDALGATGFPQDEVVRRIGRVELDRPFRSTWQYNNIMYQAAGLAVAAATKNDWDRFVEKRIFTPLGMTGATARNTVAMKNPDCAWPHNRNEAGAIAKLEWRPYENGPAGSILASTRGMTKWLRFQLGDGSFDGKRLVSKANFAEMHSPQMVIRLDRATRLTYPDTNLLSYGLGWFIHDHRGHHLLSHTGGLDGFRCRIVLCPDAKLGILLLSNSGIGASSASLHYIVTNDLLDLLLGLPKKDWNAHYKMAFEKTDAEEKAMLRHRDAVRKTDTKPSHDLAAYTGAYEDNAYGPAQISLDDGTLRMRWGQIKVRLEHYHYDTFVSKKDGTDGPRFSETALATFRTDANGSIGSFTIIGREFRRVRSANARVAGTP